MFRTNRLLSDRYKDRRQKVHVQLKTSDPYPINCEKGPGQQLSCANARHLTTGLLTYLASHNPKE